LRLDLVLWDRDHVSGLHTWHTVLGPTLDDGLTNPRVIVQDHVHLDFGLLSRGTLIKVKVPMTPECILDAFGLENSLDLLSRR
jgi:hypothetical protein